MWRQILVLTVFLEFISLSKAASQTVKDDKEKFMCYACSYTVNQQSYGFSCVNETSMLPPNHVVKCGNYCITSEHWDKRTRQLDSVFRSCSNNLGNVCREDETAVTCLTSCKGELCNNVTLGGPHEVNEKCDKYVCHNGAKRTYIPNIFRYLYILTFIYL